MAQTTEQIVLDYFKFYPSRDMAIIALALFLAASLAVFVMTVKTRTWYMLVAVAVGLLEAGGFICRYLMFNTPGYGTYVAMQCLLIIPPSFLALVQYLTLGRVVTLVQRHTPDVSLPIRGAAVSWGYFAAELGSLALQGAGAGLSVSPDSAPKNGGAGRAMLLIGLALLVAIMVTYMLNAVWVHLKPVFGVRRSPSLTLLFWTLYLSTTLLLTRNIFRMIEFADGWYGKLARDEVLFYVLDSLMILLILIISAVAHYGLFLNRYVRERQQAAPQPPKAGTNGIQLT